MVVLAEEATGVQTGAIRMGTVTTKATSPLATPVLETILQPIPTGMNILGLELKSKFAWRLAVSRSSKYHAAFFFFIHIYMIVRLLTQSQLQRK